MKSVVVALVVLSAQNLFAAILPNGVYQGTGKWTSPDGAGEISTMITILESRISITYDEPGHNLVTTVMDLVPSNIKGEYLWFMDLQQVGMAICDQVEQRCEFIPDNVKIDAQDVITVKGGKLHRKGFVTTSAGTSTWEEELSK